MIRSHPRLAWLAAGLFALAALFCVPLGIEAFGQSGDIPDLYRAYKLDAAAIIDAVARSIA